MNLLKEKCKIIQNARSLHIIVDILEYCLCLLLILECNSVYTVAMYSTMADTTRVLILITATLLIALMAYLNREKIRLVSFISDSIVVFGLLIMLAIFYFANVRFTNTTQYFVRAFLVFIPFMFYLFRLYRLNNRSNVLFYKITDIILIIALISLVLWVCSSVFSFINPSEVNTMFWGKDYPVSNYFNLFFTTRYQMEKLPFVGHVIYRNIGIFTESPMYNIFLVLGLYTELFMKKKQSVCRILILCLTIMTTFGTIGLAIMMVGLGTKFILCLKINKKYYFIIILIILICSVAGIIFLLLNKRVNSSSSYNIRLDDYAAGFKTWLTAPFFGTGLSDIGSIQRNMSEFRYNNMGYSNSVMEVLANGGLCLFTIYIIPFVAIFLQALCKRRRKICVWGVGIFALYVTTIFEYHYIMFVIMAYGYSLIDLPLKNLPGINRCLKNSTEKNIALPSVHRRRKTIYERAAIINLIIGIFASAMVQMSISTKKVMNSGIGLSQIGVIIVIFLPFAYWILITHLELKTENDKKYGILLFLGLEMMCSIILIVFISSAGALNYLATFNYLYNINIGPECSRFLVVIFAVLCVIVLIKEVCSEKKGIVKIIFYGLSVLCIVNVYSALTSYKLIKNHKDDIEQGISMIQNMAIESDDKIYVDDMPYVYSVLDAVPKYICGTPPSDTQNDIIQLANKEPYQPSLNGIYKMYEYSDGKYMYFTGDRYIQRMENLGFDYSSLYYSNVSFPIENIHRYNPILTLDSDGLCLDGTGKSIYYSPFITWIAGELNVTMKMRLNEFNSTDQPIIRVYLVRGGHQVWELEKNLYFSDFDENGNATVSISKNIKTSNDLEILMKAENGTKVYLQEVYYTRKN